MCGRLTDTGSRQGDQLGNYYIIQIKGNDGTKQDKVEICKVDLKQKRDNIGYCLRQSIRKDDFHNFPMGSIIHSWECSFYYSMEQLIFIKPYSSMFFFHHVAFCCCIISISLSTLISFQETASIPWHSLMPIRCGLSRI